MGSDLPVEHGPSAASTASPAAWPTPRAAERDLGFTAEIGLEDGLRELVEWWRRSASRSPRTRRGGGAMSVDRRAQSRINVMQPWLGEEEVAAVAEVVRSGWVAQGPRVAAVRGRLRRVPAGRRTPSRLSSCTTALHLALVVAGVGPGRRGRRAVVLVHRDRQRAALRRRHAGLRRRRPGHRQPHRRDDRRGAHPAHPRGDRRAPGRRARSTSRAIRALCDPLGRRRGRGRRLRGRVHRARPPGRRRGRDRRLVVPPAQAPHHRRGRHAHHVARRLGRARPPAARARHERLRRRPARQRARRRRRPTSRSASTTG